MGLLDYKFYRDKDGTNPFHKLVASMKGPICLGVVTGLSSVLTEKTKQMDNFATIGRIIRHSFPLCGAAFFFSSGTFIAAKIRNADDSYNHVVGVLATVPVMLSKLSVGATIGFTVPLLYLACMIKQASTEYNTRYIKKENKLPMKGTMDWWLWSQSKPPGAPYIKYD